MSLENLRELLAAEPSPSVWSAILAAIRRADDATVAVAYVHGHLSEWPDALRVLDGPDAVPWPLVAAPPWWSLGRVLSLRGRSIKPDALAGLLASTAFDGFVGLDLGYNSLGVDGIRTLVDSARVGQLRWLDLECVGAADAGLVLLAGCEGLAGVERLTLRRSKAKAKGCAALLSSPYLTGMRHLELQRNGVGAGGLAALAGNGAAAALETLDVQACSLSARAIQTLLESDNLPRLRSLSLAENQLGGDVPRLFETAKCAATLEHLSLGTNPLGHAVGDLAAAPLHALRTLALTGCSVTEAALTALAAAPWAPGLQSLDVSFEHADVSAGVTAIGRVTFAGMRQLDLSWVDLLPEELAEILTSEGLPGLEALSFRAVRVDRSPAGVSLAEVPGLHKLDRLALAGAPGGMTEVETIMATANLRGVTHITISPSTPVAAIVGIARNPTATNVGQLDAPDGSTLCDVAATAIAQSPYLRLHTLRLIAPELTDAGVAALAGSSAVAGLHTLELSGRLSLAGVTAVATSPHLQKLLHLEITGPEVGYDSWDVLTAHGARLARSFLSGQPMSYAASRPNREIAGLQGYAKHLGAKGTSRLTVAELVDRLVEVRCT